MDQLVSRVVQKIKRAKLFNTKAWKRWNNSGEYKAFCLKQEVRHWDEQCYGMYREGVVARYVAISVSISLKDQTDITFKVVAREMRCTCCSSTMIMIHPDFRTKNANLALEEYNRLAIQFLRGNQSKNTFENNYHCHQH